MKTFTVRIDYIDNTWSLHKMKASTLDQATQEIEDAAIHEDAECVRIMETEWNEVSTIPHVVRLKEGRTQEVIDRINR